MSFSETLRHRITIQQQSSTVDALGQRVQAWSTFAQAWADIRNAGGLETIKADKEASIVKASIRLRYRTDLNPGMRVLYGSTVYDIEAVLPDMKAKRHVDLVCKVVT
jgi:SPP1 family predicted phage head-tail adaptor